MATTEPVTNIVKRIGQPLHGDNDEEIRSFLTGFTAKELRSACRIYHVKVRSKTANLDSKVGYENVLVELARSQRESENATRDKRDKRQGSAGVVAAVTTHAGAVAGRNAFWVQVAVDYVKDRPEYGRLVSAISRFKGVDPHHIVPHTSEKLMQI
ncbi:uncharacterized protein PITG_09368 [Phytophthora infestans T30-4]|uniref:Uncharacterized protein n=1 Tax=Phytophthora infestans (strain T30-4) TaxID=403677 RepID=D0NBI3_PHYIT|nr:uncharacterized protein PITG_09368 [Phytophthora infestans T30-4]EEY55412.1 hypothetical protein PITG_09368 [Phytophthora infestans T30-4]|eukprot:XP_002903636.1 hypothetical protein PITG_09368 [Phytophthora infestans T30-4]